MTRKALTPSATTLGGSKEKSETASHAASVEHRVTHLRPDGRIPINPVSAAALVKSERWLTRVEIAEDGCWLWTGTISNGYGLLYFDGRSGMKAHRIALVAVLGRDLENEMEAGHLCHDLAFAEGRCESTDSDPCSHRRCVNPAHLAEQTRQENNLAGGTVNADHAARTHCPRGHALIEGNLTAAVAAKGWRDCRTCALERSRVKNEKVRDASLLLGMTQQDFTGMFGQGDAVLDLLLDKAVEIRNSPRPLATAVDLVEAAILAGAA